jgi:hypothetical protein
MSGYLAFVVNQGLRHGTPDALTVKRAGAYCKASKTGEVLQHLICTAGGGQFLRF